MVGGHAHIVKRDRPGIGASLPHVRFFFTQSEAFCILFDNEPGHATITRIGIGLGEDEKEISVASTGDPHL